MDFASDPIQDMAESAAKSIAMNSRSAAPAIMNTMVNKKSAATNCKTKKLSSEIRAPAVGQAHRQFEPCRSREQPFWPVHTPGVENHLQ